MANVSGRTPSDVIREVERLAGELTTAERAAASAKAALLGAVPRALGSEGEALEVARYLYWHVPDVPSRLLAELGTGLVGGRADHAFQKANGSGLTDLSCRKCEGPIYAQSRDHMKRLMSERRRTGENPICPTCAAPTRAPVPAREPVARDPDYGLTNPPPTAFEREVLELHAKRAEAKWIEVFCLYGMTAVKLQPDHIRAYLADPDAGAAMALGVTKEDYTTWLRSGGSVQCDGVTLAGRRCKHTAKGMTLLELDEWRRARGRGGYCTAHGG